MQVTMYKDTQDEGDSVLIADNGKVTFIKGQPQREELVIAVLGATWSEQPVHVELANRIKGEELATIVTTALGPDLPENARQATDFLDGLAGAMRKGLEEAEAVHSASTKYLKAIAMSLISIDKWDDIKRNIALASRDLGSCPPIVNLLVRTLEADRFISTQAHVQTLDAMRDVVEQLQAIAKGDAGQAHAGVVALLAAMGIPLDGCPCCGSEHHEAPGANATGYSGRVHVPGSRSIN